MAEMLFPKRQRCKKCQQKLGGVGELVMMGLYCSPRCAGLAPLLSINAAPRECWTQRSGDRGERSWKRRYRSEGEIPLKLREDPSANHYWCQHCGHLHIGHSRIDLTTEAFRLLRDREALADFLVKSRGEASLKAVAEVAKVRSIRIKEWEDPGFDTPSLKVLFAILPLYQRKLGVALKAAV